MTVGKLEMAEIRCSAERYLLAIGDLKPLNVEHASVA
jgi:hypothetical protein